MAMDVWTGVGWKWRGESKMGSTWEGNGRFEQACTCEQVQERIMNF